jgi:hypothetical protein
MVKIKEIVSKDLIYSVYDSKWIPTSSRFVSVGKNENEEGLIKIYSLTKDKKVNNFI